MSYEGYVQRICNNGHLSTVDAYDEDHSRVCSICNSEFVWRNAVDDTNDDEYGIIPPEMLECLIPASLNKVVESKKVLVPSKDGKESFFVTVFETITKTTHAVYRVPSKEETQKLRKIS